MKLKTFVLGTVFITLSLAFYPLVEVLFKETTRSINYALLSSYDGEFYGMSLEMVFLMIAGFAVMIITILSFGFSASFFVYDKTLGRNR